MGQSCSSEHKPPATKVLNVYFSVDGEPFVCNNGPVFKMRDDSVLHVDVTKMKASTLRRMESRQAVPLQLFYTLKQKFLLYVPSNSEKDDGYISPRDNFVGVLSNSANVLDRFNTVSGGRWLMYYVTDIKRTWHIELFDGVVILPTQYLGCAIWPLPTFIIQ